MRAADNRYRLKMFQVCAFIKFTFVDNYYVRSCNFDNLCAHVECWWELWFAINWYRILSIQSKYSLKSLMSVIKCISPMCKYAEKNYPCFDLIKMNPLVLCHASASQCCIKFTNSNYVLYFSLSSCRYTSMFDVSR